MAATYIVNILLASLVVADATAGLLPQQSSSQGLLDTKAADTVRALDTNGNGKVDKSEIAVFARSQGLSTNEVLADFQELDVNKDGELDSTEISGLLGDANSDAGQATPLRQEAAKPTSSEEISTLAASPKEATAEAVTPALSSQKDKDSKVIAAEVKPPVAAPALRAQSAKLRAASAQETKSSEVESSPAAAESPQAAMNIMGLDLASLEHDAQEQAGNVMASRLAQRAQVLLARSIADEHKAKQFDVEVRTLRSNATALAQQVTEDTREAARTTVSDVAQKSLAKLKNLQEQENQAQIAADDHRAQAVKAMERVRKAQASLRVG